MEFNYEKRTVTLSLTELSAECGIPYATLSYLIKCKIVPDIKETKDIKWLKSINKIISNYMLASKLSVKPNIYLRTAMFLFPKFDEIELYVVEYLLQRKRHKNSTYTEHIIVNLINKYGLKRDEAKTLVKKVYAAVHKLRQNKSIALEAIDALLED